jgi:hypothetical protein
MIIAAISLVIGGLAVYRVGQRSENDELPRQGLMGLRTKATMTSDEAWYAAQRAGADLVKASGAIAAIGGLVSIPLYNRDAAAAAVILGTAAVVLIIAVWAGFRGQAAAKAVGSGEADHQV